MTGCYSLKGMLQCIGGYIVKTSLPVIYSTHLTMFYVYGLFFEDGFHLVLLFYFQAFLNYLNGVGIQNTEIHFLLILGVRALLILSDQFATGIFWAINSKWVKY